MNNARRAQSPQNPHAQPSRALRIFRACGRFIHDLVVPVPSAPRDVVAVREEYSGWLQSAGRLLSYASVVAAVLTILQLWIFLRGDANYVLAVLQHTSLTSGATMMLSTVGMSLFGYLVAWASMPITNPRLSASTRRNFAFAWLILAVSTISATPVLFLFLAVISYLAFNLTRHRLRPSPAPNLKQWAKENEKSDDLKMRQLAREAATVSEESSQATNDLRQKIGARQDELRGNSARRMGLALAALALPMYNITISAAPFSATYTVSTASGSRPAYVLSDSGPQYLIIDLKSRSPQIVDPDQIGSLELCSEPTTFLLRPLLQSDPLMRGC